MARKRTTTDIDDLMPCTDAAARIGISRSHLYGLAKSGVIPSQILFGRRLVRLADVERWAAQPVDPAKGGRPRGSGGR